MAATVTYNQRHEGNYSLEMAQSRGIGFALASIAFDSSYPTGGEAITPPFKNIVGMSIAGGGAGYTYEYDITNKKILVYSQLPQPVTAGIIDDSDGAAGAGADLQIAISDHAANVVEENAWNGMIGRFEAINGGNADVHTNQFGTAASASNPTFSVWDNDNAETETAVMADVYAAPAGGGLYAVTLSGLDTYVPLSNGEFLKVAYDADPAGNQTAVQVYYDHDAANAHERLLLVAVDNADETLTVASEISLRREDTGAPQEIASTTDLSAVTALKAVFYGYN